MRAVVGDSVLTSPIWNWGVYYLDTVKAAMNKTWATHEYWGGMKEGIVGLAELSPKVPQSVRDQVDAAKAKILSGELDNVFCGPINDQSGAEKVAAGSCMEKTDVLNMNWFVEGVVGSIPSN
jgi:basic membrane protein A